VQSSIDPFSSGSLVAPDSTIRHLNDDDFQIDVDDIWRSPRSAATYPVHWTVSVRSAELTLEIEPYLADQELNVSYAYW
jgi:predicted secreted hydrolase